MSELKLLSEHDLESTIRFWSDWLDQKKSASVAEFMVYGGRALDACKELLNRRADGWIPVSERPPEKKDTTQGCWLLANWKEGNEVAPMLLRDVIECAEEGLLTHWRPLPAPPQGVDQG